MVFFGISGNKFTSSQRFKIEMSKISKSDKNKLSNVFARADTDLMKKFRDEGEESKNDNKIIYLCFNLL